MIEKPVHIAESEIPSDVEKIDVFPSALRELFFIENPTIQKSSPDGQEGAEKFATTGTIQSVWVYYALQKRALRVPNEETYFKLRTARNRNLITDEEQSTYRNARVGIAGLSVGSTVFATLVASGGPRIMKIADPDTIEITNLNRIRANLLDVGMNKVDVAARDAWEIDPFMDIELWREGVRREELPRFIQGLDVFVDEMDDIAVKIESRRVCKQARVPVLMATDNGDSVILDVERFDLETERPIFHGRVEISEEETRSIDRATFIRLANQIIDVDFFTKRQHASILEIGKTLSGVPQIATAASIAGAAVAFAVRQISAKQPMPSGRYILGCDHSLQTPIA